MLRCALTRPFFLQRETVTIKMMTDKAKTAPAKPPTAIFHSMQTSDARSATLESGHRPKEVPSVASSSEDFPKIK